MVSASTAETTDDLRVALTHARSLLSQSPALAAEQAREILRVVPGQSDAELLLAGALRRIGDLDHARALLHPLRQKYPRSAPIWLEWGELCACAGEDEIAARALKRAVDLDPGLVRGWLALADHCSATEDARGAAVAYAQFLRHSTRDPELLRAAEALCANQIPDAEHLLRVRLYKAPTDVAAIRMLAEVAARLGRHDDAEHLLARCLELSPQFAAARQQYAMLLHRNNKPQLALAQIDWLQREDPGNASVSNLKAAVLCRTGDYGPAIDIYRDLVRQFPNQAKLFLSYGHALKTAGRGDEAIAAYRRCIAIEPGFGEAYWSLANLKTFRFDSNDVATMRTQLRCDDLPQEQRAQFEFALGKATEDDEAYAESFAHYAQGNALRRDMIPYDPADARVRVQRSKALFAANFFAERVGWGAEQPDPIFVVGLPRSGSTLIEQILSSHSAVEGTMELPEIISITRELREESIGSGRGSYHDALERKSADEIRALGLAYLGRTRIQRKQDMPFFIDKMPNNFFHVGLIHLILPNAKIIDARRHPLACCFSGFKQYFARGQNFSYGLEDLGHYYRDYVELMAHFDAVLPGRVHRVIYERMVDDTESEVRRLLDYCGLAFEDRCLRFFENNRPVRTASSEQVRRPIYREGIDHWRHFEPWLGPLKTVLGDVLEHYPDPPGFPVGRQQRSNHDTMGDGP
ncbi:MAG: sulfotransferase [Xanthomonadales bacterium]|jgi:predicted Zn-dependent protease|nr:sulfotransferase [Xanthomonadales bacterium]